MNISSNMSSSNTHSNHINSILHSNMNTSNQRSFTSNQTSRRKSSFFRKKTLNSFDMKSKNRLYKMQFGPHNPKLIENKKYWNNIIKTTKYNVFTLIPKNLFYQFTRVSNIYFLIVSILTCLSFSPKEPASMIGTFVFVLFFTMCKDAIEDLGRYSQDRNSNNRTVLRFVNDKWIEDKCYNLTPGDIIKIRKEEEFSCDAVIIYSSNNGGYLYLDTKNLELLLGKEDYMIKITRSFANSMISRHTNDIKDSNHTLPLTNIRKNEDGDNCTNSPLYQMAGSANVLEELNKNMNGRGKGKKANASCLYPENITKNIQISEATEVQIETVGLNEVEATDRKKRMIKKNYLFEELTRSFKLNNSVGNNEKKMNTMPYIDNEMKDIIDGGKSVSSKSPFKKVYV